MNKPTSKAKYKQKVKAIRDKLDKADIDEWPEIKKNFYNQDAIVTLSNGDVFFNPKLMTHLVNAKHISYSKFLDLQFYSLGTSRDILGSLLENQLFDATFCGNVTYINKKKHLLLFNKIRIDALYGDGDGFESTINHVWISQHNFGNDVKRGNKYLFEAQPYIYLKYGGQVLDYGLKNPSNIQKLSDYHVPTKDDLAR